MSKSKGNGIIPDDLAQKYGVDSLRLALMFSAPPESDVNFDESSVFTMFNFIDKVSNQVTELVSKRVKNTLSEKQIRPRDLI